MNPFLRLAFRFARKSRTFRTIVTTTFGNPTWSGADVRTFITEGYRKNPIVYAAVEKKCGAVAAAPPVLYRIADTKRLREAIHAGYRQKGRFFDDLEALRESASPARVALHIAKRDAVHIQRLTHAPAAMARRFALKRLAMQGTLEEITAHPVLDILHSPNAYYQESFTEFVKAQVRYLELTGEAFIEPKSSGGDGLGIPAELYVLPSYEMHADKGSPENPLPGFTYAWRSTHFDYLPRDPARSEIFFTRYPNPEQPMRGMSPLEAALRSVDISNQARKYNKRLLERGGMPPGAIIYKDVQHGLSQEAQAALQEAWDEEYAGAENAGRPLFLGGNQQFVPFGFDLEKLMWGETLQMSAREISMVFGVPSVLLGDTEAQKFLNMPAALRNLYFHAAFPLADKLYGFWNATWLRRFGDDLILDYDTDAVEAVQEDVEQMYERLEKASFLTLNEKRVAVGWERVAGGDVILVPKAMVQLVALPEGDAAPGTGASGDGLASVAVVVSANAPISEESIT